MQSGNTQEDFVVLVDDMDREIGIREKLEAHKLGLLHRAFSIVYINSAGKMLLQKRHSGKYHSGGLWANSCCGHPRPGEKTEAAAKRRFREELGLDVTPECIGKFIYCADLGGGMTENELDYVFLVTGDDAPMPHPLEIEEIKFVDPLWLADSLQENPDIYSAWLPGVLSVYLESRKPFKSVF
jgi:isopentenyl-diphosphate Delta-isomerase